MMAVVWYAHSEAVPEKSAQLQAIGCNPKLITGCLLQVVIIAWPAALPHVATAGCNLCRIQQRA
jgi:hypothetical protein